MLVSTNSNNKVNFSSGTKEVFVTLPEDKLVFLAADGSNNISEVTSSTPTDATGYPNGYVWYVVS